MELVILPEIKKALFSLREEEFAALESSVLAEGIRDELIVWPNDGQLILVDGHNRYELAQKHGLEFKVQEKNFTDLEEAIAWIEQNQLGRRNLTDEQRLVILGRKYERQKKAAVGFGDRDLSEGKSCPRDRSHATAKTIAAQAGVSERTVRNAANFAKAVDAVKEVSPEAAEKILSGEVKDAIASLPKAVKQNPELLQAVADEIADGTSKTIKDATVTVKRKKMAERSKEIVNSGSKEEKPYRIFQCNIDELSSKIESESVDVIITDPPYSIEYLPLYEILAKLADKVLKPGGCLIVMAGQSYLPEVLAVMTPYINYHWTLAYLTPGGQSAQIWQRRVNTFWKPVLWFAKEKYEGKWVGDVPKSAVNGNDKRFHDWGQSESGMADLIERFTNPGDVVLDPFVGGGTTGVVAVRIGRKFIGTDVDASAIETATVRISEASPK